LQTGLPFIEEVHGPADQPGSRLTTTIEAYFGLRFDVRSSLRPQSGGTLLELHVETHWPRGLGLLGRLVEAAILSPREGQKELGRLKALIESDLGA